VEVRNAGVLTGARVKINGCWSKLLLWFWFKLFSFATGWCLGWHKITTK